MQGLLNVREVRLSPRERQLTELISRGLGRNKQSAAELQITEGTVKVYLCKLFRKTGVHDRYELALHGLRNLGVSGVSTGTQDPQQLGRSSSQHPSDRTPRQTNSYHLFWEMATNNGTEQRSRVRPRSVAAPLSFLSRETAPSYHRTGSQ
jgi:DNA-binding CsgD family transcriptional regulator